jgi:hypothetical protein
MNTTTTRSAGRPRLGKDLRVTVTISVDPLTLSALQLWTGQRSIIDPRASPGQIVDRLVNEARHRHFNPTNH